MPQGVYIPARAEDLTLSFGAGVDTAAQGAVFYRNNASRYVALPPGTAGQVFTSGGPAANPAWVNSTALTPSSGAVILAPAASTRNVIQPTAANVAALTLKAVLGQSANLLRTRNSSDDDMFTIGPQGEILSAVDSTLPAP
jgi:hypothetical protein